jgi:DNA-binding LacI/PurR family transcriptional regulator
VAFLVAGRKLGKQNWHDERFRLLSGVGKSYPDPIEVTLVESLEEDWYRPGSSGVLRWLDTAAEDRRYAQLRRALRFFTQHHEPIMQESREHLPPEAEGTAYEALFAYMGQQRDSDSSLRHAAQSRIDIITGSRALHPILTGTRRTTAIVAPNDALASSVITTWLNACGLAVPRDISLIGFDNQTRDLVKRVTSVDPGFTNLAYSAAAAITGSGRIARTRRGDCAVSPFVVDRGGVGHMR